MVLLAMTEERTWEVPMADKVEGSGWFQYSEEAWERITRHAEETCLTSCQSATRFALPHERKEVARCINGDTATVFFIYAQTLDPYGDNPDLPRNLIKLAESSSRSIPPKVSVSCYTSCQLTPRR